MGLGVASVGVGTRRRPSGTRRSCMGLMIPTSLRLAPIVVLRPRWRSGCRIRGSWVQIPPSRHCKTLRIQIPGSNRGVLTAAFLNVTEIIEQAGTEIAGHLVGSDYTVLTHPHQRGDNANRGALKAQCTQRRCSTPRWTCPVDSPSTVRLDLSPSRPTDSRSVV